MGGQALQYPILNAVALAEQSGKAAVIDDIGKVRNGIESIAYAVGISNVLKEPFAVQPHILALLIVRQYLHMGQAKAGQETLKFRGGFTGFFRLGIDHIRTVHGPGADAHHHTGMVPKQLPQADLLEEGILSGHMTAGQDDQIGVNYQLRRPVGIAAIQHLIGTEMDARIGEGHKHIRAEDAVKIRSLRTGANIQAPGIGRQTTADTIDEAVLIAEGRAIHILPEGRTGEKGDHMVSIFCCKLLFKV